MTLLHFAFSSSFMMGLAGLVFYGVQKLITLLSLGGMILSLLSLFMLVLATRLDALALMAAFHPWA